MQLGMVGLGRMGSNMVRRLLKGGHQCVVFDMSPKAVDGLVQEKAVGSLLAPGFRAEAQEASGGLVDGPSRGRGPNPSPTCLPHLEAGDILHRRGQFLLRG